MRYFLLQSPYYYRTILSLWFYLSSTTSQNSFLWCCHIYISLWKSTTALSAMPHLVCRINFIKNFANLSMMGPCHCHLIFLSLVHHHHHHHHHFHYASLHLCSTLDSKLTFSINPSHHSLPQIFGQFSRIFMTISGLNCSSVFLLFCSFHLFCLIRVID